MGDARVTQSEHRLELQRNDFRTFSPFVIIIILLMVILMMMKVSLFRSFLPFNATIKTPIVIVISSFLLHHHQEERDTSHIFSCDTDRDTSSLLFWSSLLLLCLFFYSFLWCADWMVIVVSHDGDDHDMKGNGGDRIDSWVSRGEESCEGERNRKGDVENNKKRVRRGYENRSENLEIRTFLLCDSRRRKNSFAPFFILLLPSFGFTRVDDHRVILASHFSTKRKREEERYRRWWWCWMTSTWWEFLVEGILVDDMREERRIFLTVIGKKWCDVRSTKNVGAGDSFSSSSYHITCPSSYHFPSLSPHPMIIIIWCAPCLKKKSFELTSGWEETVNV